MTQQPDTEPGNYYVSVRRDDGDMRALVGPYRDNHAGALAMVKRASYEAEKVDPKAVWYAFGTIRTDYTYDRPGILNQQCGFTP
jgi:hypothetical protein